MLKIAGYGLLTLAVFGMSAQVHAGRSGLSDWQASVTVMSNYLYRGFSYSDDLPTTRVQVLRETPRWRVFVQAIPVKLADERGLEYQTGALRRFQMGENLTAWGGLLVTRSAIFASSSSSDRVANGVLDGELNFGFRWQRGRSFAEVDSFFGLDSLGGGVLSGSRHVDITLGWQLAEHLSATAAWGNTRSFAYLDDNDHDYYRFGLQSERRRQFWSLEFERAYDTGYIKALNDDPKIVFTLGRRIGGGR